jgi:hypothetical protein
MENKAFWCQNCTKKYFLPAEMLVQYERSVLQKKPPFFDHAKPFEQKTESKMIPQKKIYKCVVCGHTMKEIENVSRPDISS